MARIPDDELQRIKTEISLIRLVERQGRTLTKQGKDVATLCPFHEEDTPSLIISPNKNVYHCFGCNAGGTVIDWVMQTENVSFRHAVELLQNDLPVLASSTKPAPRSRRPKLDALPVSDDDQAMLNRVIDYYYETLLQSPEALSYLEQRGLNNPELIKQFKLGFANRTLGYRLEPNTNRMGQALRGQLQRLGVYRSTGHEHLNGSLVIPIIDEKNNVVQAYGRKITAGLRQGTPLHVYLPKPHSGVFNLAGFRNTQELILCEALIDALTFWANGFRNVTCSYGVHGFTDELLQAILINHIKTVLIAYDRDKAGDDAATELAQTLIKHGIDCYRVVFPKDTDANAFACEAGNAQRSLHDVLRAAAWIGQGEAKPLALDINTSPVETQATEKQTDVVEKKNTEVSSQNVEEKTQETTFLAADVVPMHETPPSVLPKVPEVNVPAEVTDTDVQFTFGERFYRVRGLNKNLSYEQLKVNLLASCKDIVHVDSFDLYSARHRQSFIQQAATELGIDVRVIKTDLGKVLLKCEALQEAQIKQKQDNDKQTKTVQLDDNESNAALALLKSPDLLHTILHDINRCGLVGENNNALASYLACISRKLDGPLAILVQSTSAAGKSSLMDAVLNMMPEEDRVQYSAMTGQSLFYMGETDLKHKILAIAEEEGASQASYALKLLQSEGVLTIASTGKDETTGNLVTKEYRVEGPVMLFLTTTAIDIDEELLNRCLVLTINESREQTRAIHQLQREKRTLEGLLQKHDKQHILKLHRNAQRLLKPLHVLNPFARRLTFLDSQTRMRRDHEKYLTLIDSIALLHQYQREVKQLPVRSSELVEKSNATNYEPPTTNYIEVTLDDITLANQLAHEILGRTLDELPPQTRTLLNRLYAMVQTQCQAQNILQSDYRFSRKQIRDHIGWGDTQLRIHLERLVSMEYLVTHGGTRGQRYVYELLYDGQGEDGNTFLHGLIDVNTLKTSPTTTSSRGQDPEFAGGSRPVRGANAGGSRPAENVKTDVDSDTYEQSEQKPLKRTSKTKKNNGSYRSHDTANVM